MSLREVSGSAPAQAAHPLNQADKRDSIEARSEEVALAAMPRHHNRCAQITGGLKKIVPLAIILGLAAAIHSNIQEQPSAPPEPALPPNVRDHINRMLFPDMLIGFSLFIAGATAVLKIGNGKYDDSKILAPIMVAAACCVAYVIHRSFFGPETPLTPQETLQLNEWKKNHILL